MLLERAIVLAAQLSALLHGAPYGAHIPSDTSPAGVPPWLHAAAVARACKRKLVACSFCCAALCGADP